MPRLRRLCTATAMLVGGAALVLATLLATVPAWRTVAQPGPALAEDALAAGAGLLALLLAGWLLLAVTTSVLAGLAPSGRGGVRSRLAAATAPMAMRRTVAALLGASVVGIAAAAPASAAPGRDPVAVQRVSGAAAAAGLDPGWAAPAAPAAAEPAPPSARSQVSLPAPARRPGPDADGEVVVRRGDTLWAVAARHLGSGTTAAEVAEAWPRWYAVNRVVIGPDPDHIEPGMRLHPPRTAPGGH